jgi:Rps23 Pro-64 3,4-dihydroxylase Tpa1-like proline 4-hydroxylase
MLNKIDYQKLQQQFLSSEPFNHVVIDNFFEKEFALKLEKDFPDFNDKSWYHYDNPIEHKKAMNHWDKFPKNTYETFSFLNSKTFIDQLEKLTNINELIPDIGLNGGGWHMHGKGGKLNVHLDYSIHPKLMLERRINIIIYLCKDWQESWGGELGLWSHDEKNNAPKDCIHKISPIFNRAVIFDTTKNSWHGLPEELKCPDNVYRKSLAIYYLSNPRKEASKRGKALFAPYKDQVNDPKILELIQKRSNIYSAKDVYKK